MSRFGERSFARGLFGVVFLVASVIVLAAGFAQMLIGLTGPGYGSSAMWISFAVLGVGGGLMSLGLGLLIWEASIRYGIPR